MGTTGSDGIRRPLGEVGWVLALVGAVAVLFVRHPPLPFPLGSDWEQYLSAARYFFWDGEGLPIFPDWRKPLYPLCLGMLGELVGYTPAAAGIARVSVAGIFLGTALAARALAGRWAAVAAVVTLLWIPEIDAALNWANLYPMLAGFTALAVGWATVTARWPHPVWGLLAGLAAGFALATDARGLSAIPLAGALVCLGAFRARRPTRAISVVIVFCMGASVGPMWDAQIEEVYRLELLSLDEQVVEQRRITLDQIRLESRAGLTSACADAVPEAPSLPGLRTECAAALRSENGRTLSGYGLVPGVDTLLFLLMAVLPLGWGTRPLRDRVASASAVGIGLGGPLLVTLVGISWVVYADRYVLQFAWAMALIVPVGAARAARLLPVTKERWRAVGAAVAAVFAVGWATTEWPEPWGPRASRLYNPVELHREGNLIAWLSRNLEVGDHVLDCAGVNADLALLPDSRGGYELLRPEVAEQCPARVASPPVVEGAVYLLTWKDTFLHSLLPLPASLAAAGWEPVDIGAVSDRHVYRWTEASEEREQVRP